MAGSPYFLGWTFDEPVWRGIDLSLIRRAVAAIRAHPVEQVVYFVYAPVDGRWSDPDWPDMTAYSAEADVVGHTFYPVDPGLPWEGYVERSRLEDYGWYTDRVRSWADADAPVWPHQQGHRVGDLADPPTEEGRRPDRAETRFMSFQALVHGASGVFYFPGSKLGGAIPFDAPVWDRYVRETGADVRAMGDVLASRGSAQSVTASSPDVRTLVGRRDGKTVILAVREAGGAPESVCVTLSETREGRFRVWGEGRSVAVENGVFRDDFDRYDVSVYVEE